MVDSLIDYVLAFAGAMLLTLLITPAVREINRRLGMVDAPGKRRINKVPVPRGGGLALFLGVTVSYALLVAVSGRPMLQGVPDSAVLRLGALSAVMAAIGLADDRFGMSPKLKLAGQVAVATAVWFWAGLGFRDIWPALPMWLDCLITVFWIVGAVNAFNLIDGLDGLASGLALIATLGMAGALIFSGNAGVTLFYFAFAGGLLGFLRYNYNPASVFLGDCGSMYIGFVISVLPLCSHATNSFLVSVGVPLLAMGVPIFDTVLAILRRSIRRVLNRGAESGKVMTADTDHLHHRVMRSFGLNQRKAAWALYSLAAFFVGVGLVGVMLESRTAALWMAALTVATVVVVKELASIELFDAGRLLSSVAHSGNVAVRRRVARLSVPIYVVLDAAALVSAYALTHYSLLEAIVRPHYLKAMLIRVSAVFVCLVALRVYNTIWSRAMVSNYVRLALACMLGAVVSGTVIYYLPPYSRGPIFSFTITYAMLSVFALVFIRMFRGIFRDAFYALDCSRLVSRKDVSRVLVYGAGLRYRSFRRELVRKTSSNDRIVVGLIDDDLLMRGKYIGGVRVLGTLMEAPEIINRVNADTVVIACEISDEWMKVVRDTLAPTGVKVTLFTFVEREM